MLLLVKFSRKAGRQYDKYNMSNLHVRKNTEITQDESLTGGVLGLFKDSRLCLIYVIYICSYVGCTPISEGRKPY